MAIIAGIVAVVVVCVCGGLLGVLIFGGVFTAVMGATQAPADVADRFMAHLRDQEYEQAYGLFAPALQDEFGSASGFEQQVVNNGVRPTSWSVTNRQIFNNDVAQIDGNATYVGGKRGTFRVVLGKSGLTWKITGVSLRTGS